jgi:CelD/BcsL family acetyltransferase involved in cellulose biosynthesis
MRLRRIPLDDVDWASVDAFPGRVVFQTREWLSFLAETQRGDPVVAALEDRAETVGYFTGMVVRRSGLRILGSPFPGWTTMYMGFNLMDGVPRRPAAAALLDLAFGQLRCVHVEVRDHALEPDDLRALGFEAKPFTTYLVDLTRSEEEIWARLKSSCRSRVRKAERLGVVIEEATDLGFADDYAAQLQDVFRKQRLVPTYGADRVRALIRNLLPTGRLLLLRARDPEGRCIATGIFPGLNGTMYFWGGASWREHQYRSPNEALLWHAMRYWKARGTTTFDMGGGGDYKRKYGGELIQIPSFAKPRFRLLGELRDVAQRAVAMRQRMAGRIRAAGEGSAAPALGRGAAVGEGDG